MSFLKKLFSKQDNTKNEAQIEKQYIFVELELEDYYEPFYARDLSERQVADLNKPEYMNVHQSFKLGSPVIAHIASDTSIEIFIQTNHFEANAVVKAGIVVKHAYSSIEAIFMEAVIWTSVGHVVTIPFKLNIRADDEKSRLASALISIQKEFPFYFGRVVNDLVTIDKQMLMTIPESVQNDMQITLAELYHDESRNPGPYIEIETVLDREMTTAGWVMHFDNEKLIEEEPDLSFMINEILSTVFDKIIQLADNGRFTGWVAEHAANSEGSSPYGETTTFVFTSSEPMHSNEKLHSAIMKYMKSLKGFLREDGGYPLKYEALPLIRQSGTGYGFVLIDECFLAKADELYRKMTNKEINLYSKLLKLKALDRKGNKNDDN